MCGSGDCVIQGVFILVGKAGRLERSCCRPASEIVGAHRHCTHSSIQFTETAPRQKWRALFCRGRPGQRRGGPGTFFISFLVLWSLNHFCEVGVTWGAAAVRGNLHLHQYLSSAQRESSFRMVQVCAAGREGDGGRQPHPSSRWTPEENMLSWALWLEPKLYLTLSWCILASAGHLSFSVPQG